MENTYYEDIVEIVRDLKVNIYDRIDMDKKYISMDKGHITTIDEYNALIEDLDFQYDKLQEYSENNSKNKKVYIVMQSMRNTKNDINKVIEEIKSL
ncbi:MAG: hypothetical protein ACRC5R_00255 [Mycoplasmatales bacterium]